jgi:hypothetical protein
MLLHGIDIGFVEQCFVGIGLVFLNPLHELVLPHHPKATPLQKKSAPITDWRTRDNQSYAEAIMAQD